VSNAALLLAAVYPPLIVISAPVMTEWLFLVFVLGAVVTALQTRASRSLRWAAATGALIGLATLTKAVGGLIAAILLVAIWLQPRLSWRALVPPAVALVVAAAVIAPWTIRNARAFDAFVPVANELGFGLAGAYNDQTRGDPKHEWRPPWHLPAFSALIRSPERTEAEVSRELTRRSRDYVADHPGYPFALAVRNLARLLQIPWSGLTVTDAQLWGFGSGSETVTSFKVAYWVSALAFFALLAIAVAGALRGELRGVPWFIFAVALVPVVPLIFIAAGPRFRLSIDVLLIVLAAPTAAWLAERITTLRSRREQASPQPS
jgi:4-amino-4-deoxy-L-arabinose transferase-like glycosyltransferase